jgi:hypothetical protein
MIPPKTEHKRLLPESLKWCLEKPKFPPNEGSKEDCDHGPSVGQWVVKDMDGTIYFIEPSTGLQKNFWIDSAIRNDFIEKDDDQELRKYLKWFCHGCGTIQEA